MRNRMSAVALAATLALTGVACTESDAEESLDDSGAVEAEATLEEAPLIEPTE